MTSKPVIPRLLAGRDRLSRLEKEQILDAVLVQRRRTRWWLVAAPALAAAAAAVVLLVLPARTQEFTARGSDKPVATLAASCAGGCRAGGTLVFDVHGTTGYRYFAAFAQRGDGTVVWYFPTSIDLASQPAYGVLDRGVELGAEHTPGTYRVYGVFSKQPLTRDEIKARFEGHAPDIHVVEQELIVQ